MEVLEINARSNCNESAQCDVHNTINSVNSDDITYERFFSDYLVRNRPCLLKNVTREWVCQNVWVKDEKPDFDFLMNRYGNSLVPVADCKERFFNSQTKRTMKLAEFLTYWRNYIDQQYDDTVDCFYLKDWHFANENPTERVYTVPKFFASDWINEYLVNDDHAGDDYRFVYMGPKGSWTPLHADVFSSFSWSVNICGKKKWIFLPPGEEEQLKDKFGNLVFDLTSQELSDASKYPNYSNQIEKIVLIQEIGDAVFVPSGWHHQVWNLDDTISFNHNWVNGCNIMQMWESMYNCYESVCREISDCQEMDGWSEQCQLVLKSCFGMNFVDFYRFVAAIALTRIECIQNQRVLRVNGGWVIGPNHMKFDLKQICALLEKMTITVELKNTVVEESVVDIESLILKIKNVIPEYKLD